MEVENEKEEFLLRNQNLNQNSTLSVESIKIGALADNRENLTRNNLLAELKQTAIWDSEKSKAKRSGTCKKEGMN